MTTGIQIRPNIITKTWSNLCRLLNDERFKDFVHPHYLKGKSRPKMSGKELCLRWHTTGMCFSTCRFGHSLVKNNRYAENELSSLVQGIRKTCNGEICPPPRNNFQKNEKIDEKKKFDTPDVTPKVKSE